MDKYFIRDKDYSDQLPTTATGVLHLFANTSTEVDHFSDQVITAVKEGNESPLKVLIQLKAMERASERIRKEIMVNALTEAEKFPGTKFEFLGNDIEKAEFGTKYDYASSGDPVYNQRLKILEDAAAQLKERETFLRAVKEPFNLLDEGTGEVSIITPPHKKSTSGLKIIIR